jgi:putative multiple sugar transport system permease protein
MSTTATAAASPKTIGVRARSNLREYGLMIALVVIMVLFRMLTDGTLFKPRALRLSRSRHPDVSS